jgi:putrescine:ornithine antiporter
MFNPAVGSVVMVLAIVACLGSLLGWQFTLAQTAKDAADTHMFPAVFGKANSSGAPVTGMIVMAVVQTVLALSTISPSLSEQFAVLVNLAVVTNVVPYIIALSALFVMMRHAGIQQSVYRRTGFIALVGMAYSTYALYAAGEKAVLGGMLVMVIGYVVYGFVATRFAPAPAPAAAPEPVGAPAVAR